MNEEVKKLVLETAAKSPCEKRKVGAVIYDRGTKKVLATGYNNIPDESKFKQCCEDEEGNTKHEVLHAEVAAIANLHAGDRTYYLPDLIMYISHYPCNNCITTIKQAMIPTFEVVEDFMKFDTGKLRYDLVPSSWERGDAEVLTKGAKKYKPNNWKKIQKAEVMRFYAAARRHLDDWKAFMEGDPDVSLFDDGEMEIGTHHLLNARTNIGFLYTLTETKEKAEAIREVLLRDVSDEI